MCNLINVYTVCISYFFDDSIIFKNLSKSIRYIVLLLNIFSKVKSAIIFNTPYIYKFNIRLSGYKSAKSILVVSSSPLTSPVDLSILIISGSQEQFKSDSENPEV